KQIPDNEYDVILKKSGQYEKYETTSFVVRVIKKAYDSENPNQWEFLVESTNTNINSVLVDESARLSCTLANGLLNTIVLDGFKTGQNVIVESTGLLPSPLTNSTELGLTEYFLIVNNSGSVSLALTHQDAIDNNSIQLTSQNSSDIITVSKILSTFADDTTNNIWVHHELTNTQTEVNLPFITADASGPKHLLVKVTRAKFESLVGDLVEASLKPCAQALKDAGVKASDVHEVVLVGGQTRMPLVQEKVKAFFGIEPHKGVNPDEVVAIGAAIQGAILTGDVTDVLLLDVTPLSLGIEVEGGLFNKIIEKNTTIPTKKSQTYTTAADNQTAVTIKVAQGEREIFSANKELGLFNLEGIAPAARGTPQVEVTFDIDANGIIHVHAKDKGTGKETSIRIESGSGLSEEEIERMKQDAEAHADEDAKLKENIEAKNRADQLVFATEKSLEEHSDAVDAETVTAIKEALEVLKEALKGDDFDAIKAAEEDLGKKSQKLGEAVYQKMQAEQGEQDAGTAEAPEASASKAKDDDILDAEVVDDSNSKK
ncbi:MAG: Hsp70 family protein, partial [Ghiorsea sp.]|nr:Hsp70 family protein [Ghiorsea sp.]